MPERIRLNAFDTTCVAHQSFGLWRHPDDQSHRYYDEGTTLREKIYETGQRRLRDDHPGAVHRFPSR